MEIRITLEWDMQCGIPQNNLYTFREGVELFFKDKEYGKSINTIWILMIAMGYDVKQRKRFKKEIGRLEYDILLDYFLIKNVEMDEKKTVIRRQVVEVTEQTFSNYKFEDFDKDTFLSDLKEIVNSIKW